jgi:ATP-dependent RNA helicase DDX54/DBP10
VRFYRLIDRLFEMGFDVQLREIVHRLPTVRQSLLFSATLPSSVAEFARAGLSNPALVRLDAESSLSPDLKLAFFRVAPDDKSAALLVLLDRIMRASPDDKQQSPQAIIFVATKHHVEYINAMLEALGYATSHVYGSLDQLARQRQLRQFRERQSDLLVVTDVAARGLDIPVMDNVINYDFPASARVFIHRVGRTARAGRRGAAWSLITSADIPYVCDLATTVSRDLFSKEEDIVGDIPRHLVDEKTERLASTMDETAPHLKSLRQVMQRGESMVQRSKSKASINAYREAKAAQKAQTRGVTDRVHPIFALDVAEADGRRMELMAAIGAYAPRGTVLEAGRPRDDPNGKLMQARRQLLERRSATSTRAPLDRKEDKVGTLHASFPVRLTVTAHRGRCAAYYYSTLP